MILLILKFLTLRVSKSGKEQLLQRGMKAAISIKIYPVLSNLFLASHARVAAKYLVQLKSAENGILVSFWTINNIFVFLEIKNRLFLLENYFFSNVDVGRRLLLLTTKRLSQKEIFLAK